MRLQTRPRLIPCVLLKNGLIVRSQLFKTHQVIGNPISTIQRLSSWNVDELVLLDISRDDVHDLRRNDLQQSYAGNSALDVLRAVSKECFMPLTFGGRIRTLEDIEVRLAAGADKCVITTKALEDPAFLSRAAGRFGSQCIVAGIDVRQMEDGSYNVFSSHGQMATEFEPAAWAKEAENRGAGEVFLSFIDRDGSALGYDTDLLSQVAEATSLPVIACGGVGEWQHLVEGITKGRASAVAAANIFHFTELSYPNAKRACIDAGLPMRTVEVNSRWFPREPSYDVRNENQKLAYRMERAAAILKGGPAADPAHAEWPETKAAKWCSRCCYPLLSATPVELDNHGVCMGCRVAEVKSSIPSSEWDRRRAILQRILGESRGRQKGPRRYDCVVPVSGGKDSYFQAHVLKHEFGLNPLLVTYDGNNWLDIGFRNLRRMRESLGLDHIIVSPSVATLKKLNRLAFQIMGDMNWHSHIGIYTVPMRVAVQYNIPLVFYGEHGYMDLCGQFDMNDFPEVSYRHRLEHYGRGYEWSYFLGREGLTEDDLLLWRYPSDQELFDSGLRGLYLGNYVYWEANEHIKLVTGRYGFEISSQPFDRTYRTMSNLDDMHENGVHDYLKFIKFGYGRCTDHASKDIRSGLMNRKTAVELINRYDPVKPRDLARWLDYVGMSEAEFDAIADTFRDPRVWTFVDGCWTKRDIE